MLKQTGIISKLLIIATLLSGIALLPTLGCNDNQADEGSNENIEILYKDDTSPEDKGNPKLDFNIKRLIEANEQGEAEEFARQRSIELIDGCVTVIIECEPGQAETVAEAAANADAKQVLSDSKRDLVQAVVPIPNLAALAEIPGVHLVRLPWYPEEE